MPLPPRPTRLVLLLGLLAAAPAAAQAARAEPALAGVPVPLSEAAVDTSTAQLRPGDKVRIRVWRNDDLSGEFTDGPTGEIFHPLLREVTVTGIPARDVEGRVRRFVGTLAQSPRVVVQPLFRVIVAGEVASPKIYELPPEMTVMEALTLAGPGKEARQDRMILVREGKRSRIRLRGSSPAELQLTVRSGDQIILERRRWKDYLQASAYVVNLGTFVFAIYQAFGRD
ncbi:MAG TPA: polysaccharide biosynthesis/export family protein [Longimicrobiaceae bacterium]